MLALVGENDTLSAAERDAVCLNRFGIPTPTRLLRLDDKGKQATAINDSGP
jgi:hypothetical protein